ncbi:hypothetical protein GOP47_0004708, partial [Adiantum capillus-veneris]
MYWRSLVMATPTHSTSARFLLSLPLATNWLPSSTHYSTGSRTPLGSSKLSFLKGGLTLPYAVPFAGSPSAPLAPNSPAFWRSSSTATTGGPFPLSVLLAIQLPPALPPSHFP